MVYGEKKRERERCADTVLSTEINCRPLKDHIFYVENFILICWSGIGAGGGCSGPPGRDVPIC